MSLLFVCLVAQLFGCDSDTIGASYAITACSDPMMSFQPCVHYSRLQSYSRWCCTWVVSDVLQHLPKIPQIGFTLEVHLLEEVKKVEMECHARFHSCGRELAKSE